jgi:hypothetical protein
VRRSFDPAQRAAARRGYKKTMLWWPGTDTLKAARRAIRERRAVEIELPLEVHYALHSHLHPRAAAGPVEGLEAEGGAELLGQVATVAGLEELGKLHAAVRRARYRVRVTSPQPLLRLQPPGDARKAPSAR